jgi:hypothetical protein
MVFKILGFTTAFCSESDGGGGGGGVNLKCIDAYAVQPVLE